MEDDRKPGDADDAKYGASSIGDPAELYRRHAPGRNRHDAQQAEPRNWQPVSAATIQVDQDDEDEPARDNLAGGHRRGGRQGAS